MSSYQCVIIGIGIGQLMAWASIWIGMMLGKIARGDIRYHEKR